VNGPHEDSDGRYGIGVVTRRTGLSSDVLRVWERRYAVVTPTRSAGGQRLYSSADIEKLRLLRRLVEGGHRIATVAKADVDVLRRLADEVGESDPRAGNPSRATDLLGNLIAHVEALDAESLEAALRHAVMTLGTEVWMETVVSPLLEVVGERWHEGGITPAHEHLVTATTRDVLAWVIRAFSPTPDAPLIVVSTPVGELHELGGMMAAIVAAECGWRVRYLGPNVAAGDLAAAAKQLRASAVALSVVHPDHASRSADEVRELRRLLPGLPIMVGGATAVETREQLAAAGAAIFADAASFRGGLQSVMPVG
jgi:MerR family transcriptional regulator, light-induced transcriptional regulator